MTKLRILLLAACAATLLMAGCSKSGGAIATVDGEPITQEEFQAYLKFKRLPVTDKDPQRYQSVLDQYVQRKALARAIDQRMRASDTVDADLLKAELDEFRREQLIARYFEQFLSKAVTDDAVANYYTQHAAEYSEHRVHIAHILVRTSRAMGEAERRAAQTKIQEAASKLRAGMDWDKAVTSYSEDSISAKKGGDLGWIQQGAIDPKLSEVAFELPEGKISEPFETQFGFHLLKVLEAPATKQRPLESVRGEIRYRLRNEAKDAELKKLTESVKIEKKSG
jgi:peptidyl-prolyl cis-trans isomerase C